MLWVYGHWKYVNSFSPGTVLIRQNLTYTDIRVWRIKTVPAFKGLITNISTVLSSFRNVPRTDLFIFTMKANDLDIVKHIPKFMNTYIDSISVKLFHWYYILKTYFNYYRCFVLVRLFIYLIAMYTVLFFKCFFLKMVARYTLLSFKYFLELFLLPINIYFILFIQSVWELVPCFVVTLSPGGFLQFFTPITSSSPSGQETFT